MAWIFNLFGKRPRELQEIEASTSKAPSPQLPACKRGKPATEPGVHPKLHMINEHVFEVYKPRGQRCPAVEIVFIHGLQWEGSDGAHISTWMARDGSQLWLEWIPKVFPDARILTISYDACSSRTTEQGRTDMYITRENLLQCLIGPGAEVGQSGCPVVLVGHCLGGLVMKELCLQAASLVSRKVVDKFNRPPQNFLDNLKGLFYFGTPHNGTVVAGMNTGVSKGRLFDLMTILNTEAARRSEEFRILRQDWGWRAFGVGEGVETEYDTFKGMVVKEASARSDVNTFYTDPSADHFTVCKAESIESCTFLRLSEFLAFVVNEEKAKQLTASISTHQLPPSLLPFGPDGNYVPIDSCVSEVMQALEDERRVILWGPPGMGKTSLVKYLALLYESQRRSRVEASSSSTIQFPDGVVYLNCGRNAERRLRQLQQDVLLQLGSLGLVTGPSTITGMQETESFSPESLRSKLRSCLAEKQLLIILDNVWEHEGAEQFLVSDIRGVRYLIVSQLKRCIYIEAKQIPVATPTEAQARKILANYTPGLRSKGEFPLNLEPVVNDIIAKLEYHPLSIANVGISRNSTEATCSREWQMISENLHDFLELTDQQKPPLYDAHYSFSMSASMIMVLESLQDGTRELLNLLGLLDRDSYKSRPQSLVKYVYRFVQPTASTLQYRMHEKYLAESSLIEIRQNCILTHGLRMHHIRKQKRGDMESLASGIVHVSPDQGTVLRIRRGDADETLVTILSAIHFHKSFVDFAGRSLETHIKILNDGVFPRSLNNGNDIRDLLKEIRSTSFERSFRNLFPFACTDDGEGDWRGPAREYAKKIIIRFVCQGKVDDSSMARLLELEQTAYRACWALHGFMGVNAQEEKHRGELYGTALNAYRETFNALRCLFSNRSTPRKILVSARYLLFGVLDSYTNGAVFLVPKIWLELLATDCRPDLPIHIADVLHSETRPSSNMVIAVTKCPGFLDALVALLFPHKDSRFGRDSEDALGHLFIFFCTWKIVALRIAAVPNILKMLLSPFLSETTHPRIQSFAGVILEGLLCIPEKRIEFSQIEGGLGGLGDILATMEGAWQVTSKEQQRERLEIRASLTARIVAELALEEELREAISLLPEVQEGLQFLQIREMARLLRDSQTDCSVGHTHVNRWERDPDTCEVNVPHWYSPLNSTKALTILYSRSARPSVTLVPALEQVLKVLSDDDDAPFKPTAVSVGYLYASIHLIRGAAQVEMEMYEGALADIDLAHHFLEQIQTEEMGRSAPCGFQYLDMIMRGLHDIRRLYVVDEFHLFPSKRYGSSFSSFISYEDHMRAFLTDTLRDIRIFVQAMLKDYGTALLGADERLDSASRFLSTGWDSRDMKILLAFVERGVLKSHSEDWPGALDDLNEAMELLRDYDFDKRRHQLKDLVGYDIHKHRGHVKSVLGDEAGARADAELAAQLQFNQLNMIGDFPVEATKEYWALWALRKLPITYLGFTL